MIDFRLYYVFAIVTFLFYMGTYALIRGIIWSIAGCSIGKKTRRSQPFKESKNITMSYLSPYITEYRKQFCFWMKVKLLYVIFELILLIVYLLLPLSGCNLTWPFAINIIQSFAFFIVIGAQYDVNRNTKYDRTRSEGTKNK